MPSDDICNFDSMFLLCYIYIYIYIYILSMIKSMYKHELQINMKYIGIGIIVLDF